MENDIYFEKAWQKVHAERAGYALDEVAFSCEDGAVEYRFMLRPVFVHGQAYPYSDIVTPDAYSGPLLKPAQDTPECRRRLAEHFDEYFDTYCNAHGIVAEYVQFSPWIKNHEAFSGLYDLRMHARVLGIDLTKQDLMMDELNARRRRSVRNALKNGVAVHYDDQGTMIDEFLRLYAFTVQKYDLPAHFRYDRAFAENVFRLVPGRAYFAYAMYEGRCASICLLLESEECLHYYLVGHDPELLSTNAASLVIYAAAEKAKAEGKKLFVLGGADGGLLEFKQTFTRDCYFDYYVGRKIRMPEVYRMLTEKSMCRETDFFPAYRG